MKRNSFSLKFLFCQIKNKIKKSEKKAWHKLNDIPTESIVEGLATSIKKGSL